MMSFNKSMPSKTTCNDTDMNSCEYPQRASELNIINEIRSVSGTETLHIASALSNYDNKRLKRTIDIVQSQLVEYQSLAESFLKIQLRLRATEEENAKMKKENTALKKLSLKKCYEVSSLERRTAKLQRELDEIKKSPDTDPYSVAGGEKSSNETEKNCHRGIDVNSSKKRRRVSNDSTLGIFQV
mmetsp:Transcript_2507/g.5394  ORF Transcript_2507/g.5394 Transcript_2507/m.5394 type:complete len:185 (+) Transcript_2507:60-614(+)